MAINPLAQYAGASELSTGVPQFGDILQQAIQNHYQNQLMKSQTKESQQKALQNELINKFLSGENGGGGSIGGNNEFANAFINHKLLGTTELPSQQSAREIQDYKTKQVFGKQLEQQEGTSSTITTNQNRISGIDTVLPFIDSLSTMDLPYKISPSGTTTDKAHKSAIKQAAEQYMVAKNLGSGEGILKNTMEIFERGALESDSAYRKRMQNIKKDLIRERAELSGNKSQGSSGKDDLTQMSDDELLKLYQDPKISDAERTAILDIAERRHGGQ